MRTGMMDHKHRRRVAERAEHGDAPDCVIRGAPAGVADDAAV